MAGSIIITETGMSDGLTPGRYQGMIFGLGVICETGIGSVHGMRDHLGDSSVGGLGGS